MKFIKYLFIIPLFFACSNSTKKSNDKKVAIESVNNAAVNKDFKIIGYAAGYEDYDFSKIDATKLTHINFAFANIVDGKAKFELETDKAKIATLISLKKQNPNLKVLYSVGGWVWSDQFSTMAAYEASRKKFAESCVNLLLEHGFDGVDLDWEYPGQRGEDNPFRPSDKDNFTLLLAEIRKALDVEGNKNNTYYLLTIATGADETYIEQTNLGEAHQYLDFINVMCYDFYQGWYYQTGHHANLYPSEKDTYNVNSGVDAMERHLEAGVPADKLVMGIPFYGRQWKKVSSTTDGLNDHSLEGGYIVSYKDLKKKVATGKYKEMYDESAKASYLWSETDSTFVSWETSKDIKLKAAFIKENGFGGAMFWEYSLDKDQELLNTLFENLKE
ncbi:chitinase [Polaribacter sp. ALD11]|uniref:glycoside hydrolase family 18 protein n=1 Tax=Polaribacter sp. ALD11 TaxID=2058137 RepID=UPI000C3154B3|nr:glycoside hydrolase family 18 protein [Polaribacter sp. ALD11]AUC83824.1 chitinase [Polaribacter sp. ALD11]